MLALGYGYDDQSGETTRYSRDGGIDGYIYGDKLGLEKIAFQSKLYNNSTIGKPDVASFYGVIDKVYSKGYSSLPHILVRKQLNLLKSTLI